MKLSHVLTRLVEACNNPYAALCNEGSRAISDMSNDIERAHEHCMEAAANIEVHYVDEQLSLPLLAVLTAAYSAVMKRRQACDDMLVNYLHGAVESALCAINHGTSAPIEWMVDMRIVNTVLDAEAGRLEQQALNVCHAAQSYRERVRSGHAADTHRKHLCDQQAALATMLRGVKE